MGALLADREALRPVVTPFLEMDEPGTTDRAWLVLEGSSQWRTPFQLRFRGSRNVRVEASWWTRFDGFDQPYAIDPTGQDHVNAANDALDAARHGQPWDLADAEDRRHEDRPVCP